jgi:hypothetical protein
MASQELLTKRLIQANEVRSQRAVSRRSLTPSPTAEARPPAAARAGAGAAAETARLRLAAAAGGGPPRSLGQALTTRMIMIRGCGRPPTRRSQAGSSDSGPSPSPTTVTVTVTGSLSLSESPADQAEDRDSESPSRRRVAVTRNRIRNPTATADNRHSSEKPAASLSHGDDAPESGSRAAAGRRHSSY